MAVLACTTTERWVNRGLWSPCWWRVGAGLRWAWCAIPGWGDRPQFLTVFAAPALGLALDFEGRVFKGLELVFAGAGLLRVALVAPGLGLPADGLVLGGLGEMDSAEGVAAWPRLRA